jgi:hypothetical protein
MINLNAFFLQLGKRSILVKRNIKKNGSAVPESGTFIWI